MAAEAVTGGSGRQSRSRKASGAGTDGAPAKPARSAKQKPELKTIADTTLERPGTACGDAGAR